LNKMITVPREISPLSDSLRRGVKDVSRKVLTSQSRVLSVSGHSLYRKILNRNIYMIFANIFQFIFGEISSNYNQ